MKKLFLLTILLNYTLCQAQESIFSTSFENGTIEADVGSEFVQTKNGGNIYVVDNPDKDAVNNSNKVIKVLLPPGLSQRAEYHTSPGERFLTDEKSHIYRWKVYYPEDIFTGVDVNWLAFAQWKTWPCEEYGSGDLDYSEEICEGGGIFNDVHIHEDNQLDFRFRANPDCGNLYYTYPSNSWVEYVIEIYWTNTTTGYYKLFANGQLVGQASNVKTLFDGFPADNSCDIYWGVGLYSSWSSTGADSLSYYLDDIQVFDKDDGITLEDVCPSCAGNATDIGIQLITNENNLRIYPNPATNYISFTNDMAGGDLKIYDTKGKLHYNKANILKNERIVVDLASGIYIVQVNSGDEIVTEKLLVK